MGRKQAAVNTINTILIHKGITTKVIELGCNNYKRRISKTIIGLDAIISHQPNLCCDINSSLPFKNKSISAIVGIDIIEHLDDINYFIIECQRVLRINGIMLFVIPRADIFGYKINTIKKYGHKHMWNKDEWNAIIANHSAIKIEECDNMRGDWFFFFYGIKIKDIKYDTSLWSYKQKGGASKAPSTSGGIPNIPIH